ncbi:MAG: branched-chain amino acid ABC transporter permease [Halobacteriota archaeon]
MDAIVSSQILQLDISTYLEVLVDGIAFGIFLALLGVGITLVFGLGEVLNLAIGMFAIVGLIVAQYVNGVFGLPIIATFVVGILAAGVLGVVVDRSLLSLVYRSDGEERILLGIFVTLGLAILLEGVLTNVFPSRYTLDLPYFVEQFSPFRPFGLQISLASVFVIGIGSAVLALIFAFLRGTFLGKVTRTVFQDETGARLIGVDPRRIRALVFVLSALVAGVAGIAYGTSATIEVERGFRFTIFALIVSIVGGVRSIEGTVLAGVMLGIVATFATFFIGAYLASVILFMTAVIAILIRPAVGE